MSETEIVGGCGVGMGGGWRVMQTVLAIANIRCA